MRAWPLALAHIRTHLGYVAGLHLAIASWGFIDGCKKVIVIGYKNKNQTYKPFKSMNPCWCKASGLLKVEDKKKLSHKYGLLFRGPWFGDPLASYGLRKSGTKPLARGPIRTAV